MSPAFVTCPIKTIGTCVYFASRRKSEVTSLTCVIPPGEEFPPFSARIVWTLSITTKLGILLSSPIPSAIISAMLSASVSHSKYRDGSLIPSLLARLAICHEFSSPLTYKTGPGGGLASLYSIFDRFVNL